MITGIALGRVTAWNNHPLRTQKGTGCPDLQLSSWAQCGLLAVNHRCLRQPNKQAKQTPNPPSSRCFPSMNYISPWRKGSPGAVSTWWISWDLWTLKEQPTFLAMYVHCWPRLSLRRTVLWHVMMTATQLLSVYLSCKTGATPFDAVGWDRIYVHSSHRDCPIWKLIGLQKRGKIHMHILKI